MNLKKVVVVTSMFSLCMIFGGMYLSFSSSKASENKYIQVYNTDEESNESVVIQNKIVIDEKEFNLYSVFNDEDKELENIKYICKGYIGELKDFYKLEDLCKSNWEQYRAYMYTYFDDNENTIYNEGSTEYINLMEFFDIYENKSVNFEIKNKVEEKANDKQLIEDNEFTSMLPNDVQEYIKEEKNIKSNITRFCFDTKSAISYARTYALNYNNREYKKCKFDCTNFASQIAYVGGKEMTEQWKAYKKSMFSDAYTKYTMEWCNADYFVKYFDNEGVYNSFAELTNNVQKGNVIAYDLTNDNDWDHVGFVVDKKNILDNWGYYDIEVAQHSRDYCLWASDSNNGWDDIDNNYKKSVFTYVIF